MLKQAAQPPRQGMGFCPTMALIGGRDPLIDDERLNQIRALLPDAEVHTFDFTERLGEYAGKTALGDEYRLTLGTARYNILAGRLTYATPAGLTGAPEISVVMFGDEGLLAWKDESGSSGIATVRFTDEGLMLELQGDGGWSKTEEFALEKQES